MKLFLRPLVLLALCAGSQCFPAHGEPGSIGLEKTLNSGGVMFPSPLPAGCKVTLHFERTKVAAGAINNDSHQSEWWIEVRDSKGKPKSGVVVDLPVITKGGQGLNQESPIVARIEWLPKTLRPQNGLLPLSKCAVTDSAGRARGRYTSGNREQKVEFLAAGGATASILQVWNESDENHNTDWFSGNGPEEVRYKMSFHDGQKWVPIVGHRLKLTPSQVRFNVTDPRLGPDADGDGEPDGLSDVISFSGEKSAESGWGNWLKWTQFVDMIEVKPGGYVGHYEAHIPEDATLDGKSVDGIDWVSNDVSDQDACQDE